MIVDTSALIAVLTSEPGHERLATALLNDRAIIPAPVLLEFLTVARGDRFGLAEQAETLLNQLTRLGMETVAWTADHAATAATAQIAFGKGNGRGGALNLLDLMVYAVAKDSGMPLLCTGRDFASTDAHIHPSSRVDRVVQ